MVLNRKGKQNGRKKSAASKRHARSTKKNPRKKTPPAETRGRKQSKAPKGNSEAARVARRVRALREAKNLSVRAAADDARISEAQWYKIERASVLKRTPYTTLQRVASALDTTAHELRA